MTCAGPAGLSLPSLLILARHSAKVGSWYAFVLYESGLEGWVEVCAAVEAVERSSERSIIGAVGGLASGLVTSDCLKTIFKVNAWSVSGCARRLSATDLLRGRALVV